MNRELKSKYKQDFKIVSSLINEFDLCGIIKGGAPSDEYHFLTDQILSYLYKKQSRSEIKRLIKNELVNHFGILDSMESSKRYNSQLNQTLDSLLNKIENSLSKDKK
jgi:hypothetical protein